MPKFNAVLHSATFFSSAPASRPKQKSTQSKTIPKIFSTKFLKDFKKNSSKSENRVSLVLKDRKKLRLTTIFATIVLVILIPIIALTLRKGEQAAAWFDESYQYRKAVAITNSSGSNLTDFQSSFTLDTASLITAGKMQSDCDDIRITDVNGQVLPFWIEENNPGCNQSATVIWTKVPSIPTSGATVYLYYGSPNATNAQKGENVFEFFDDFSQNTIGTKWTVQSGTWSISGGELIQTVNNVENRNIYANYPNSDIVIETRQKTLSTGIGDFTGINAREQGTGARYLFNWNTNVIENITVFRNTGTEESPSWEELGTSSTYDSLDRSTYHKLKATLNGSSLSTCVDSTCTTTTDATYASGTRVGLRSEGSNRFDYIFARKYASSDPSLSAGSEQVGKGPISYWKFDEGNGTTVYDTMGRNNGTMGVGSSAPQWKSESECITGKCLYFDGSNDYVDVADSDNLEFGTTNDFTISIWAKHTSLGVTDVILDRRTSEYVGYVIFYDPNNKVNFRYKTGGDLTSTRAIADNSWHLISVVFDRDSSRQMYIDGKLDTSDATTSTSVNISNSQQFRLGNNANPSSTQNYWFNGYIDDVKIYPYARSAAEIKSDYNSVNATQGTAVSTVARNEGGDISNGLIGYWKMDEGTGTTTSDSSGNGRTASLGASTAAPTWASGKYGPSLSFDGTNDSLTVSDSGSSDALRMSGTTEYTLAGWVYINDLSASTQHFIVSKYDFSGQQGYSLLVNNTGSIRFDVNGNANAKTTSATPITAGKWFHIAGVFSGGNKMQVFVNGSLLETFNIASTSLTAYTGALAIGTPSNNVGADAFTTYGNIDDVRIYNRALNPSEVAQLYNFAPGPFGYWSFDETSANTCTTVSGADNCDLSGNGKDGTWNGTVNVVSGKYGNAVSTDGNDSNYVSTPTFASSPSALTMQFWMKTTATTGMPIAWGGQFFCRIGGVTSNKINCSVDAGSSGSATSTTSINDGNWHNVAITSAGTSQKLYIDGVLESTATETHGSTADDRIRIGRELSSGLPYNGYIDELRIYNYVRTQSQILSDLNAGHPNVGTPVGSTDLHFKFDEGYGSTTYDSSPNGYTGTFGASTAAPTWTNSGKYGKALNFDGNDYIDVNQTLTEDSFSLTGWFKSSYTAGYQMIFSKETAAGTPWNYRLYLAVTTGNLIGDIHDGTHNVNLNSGISYTDGNWHYAVFTRDSSSDVVSLYVDGILVDTDTDTTTGAEQNSQELWIGRSAYTTGGGYYFNGSLDELKIYPFVLTAEQIKLDYNQGKLFTMGAASTASDGVTPSNDAARAYCVPGDTSTCNAPVGEWNFNENSGTSSNDSSGNNGTVTFAASTAAPTWVNGKYGSAISFDGSNDYATIPDSSNYTGSALTWDFWLKTGSGNAAAASIINKYNTTSNQRSWSIIYNSGDGLGLVLSSNGSSNQQSASSTLSDLTDKWHHISIVFNAGNVKFYYDGKLHDEATNTQTTTFDNNTSITLGAGSGGSSNPFKGTIDQFRIYKYARTPAQVAWSFNRGAPSLNYRFDECQGTTINDWSPDSNGGYNGNNATLTIGGSGTQTSVGTCSSSGAWSNGASGKINSSISLDGTDDYLEVSDPSSGILDFSDGEDFTASVWVKPTSVSSNQTIFAKKNGTGSTLIGYLGYINNQGKVVFVAATDSSNNISLFSNNLVTAGVWSHLTYVYNGSSNTAKVYINGQDAGGTPSVTGNPANLANALSFEIGAESDDQVFFGGQIDDFKLYRYALTQDQIQTDMAGGAVSFR